MRVQPSGAMMAPPEISMKIRFENLFVSDSPADTVPDMYRDHPTFGATRVREDAATQLLKQMR